MIRKIKNFIRTTYPLYVIINIRDFFSNKKLLKEWQMSGKPVPPPHIVKRLIVKEYATKFSFNILIETGTYFGDMIYAVMDTFSKLYSIELDDEMYRNALNKFKRFKHIEILHGDSGEVLCKILGNISEPCLFWLDAHYSGGLTAKNEVETPIMQEIKTILSHHIRNHCILIDDARKFVGQSNYPTIERLKEFILSKRPDSLFDVQDDIIRITFPSQ